MTYYIRANDITANRCTVCEVYMRRSQAEAAVELDDEAQVFEVETPNITGRVYHLDGKAWGRLVLNTDAVRKMSRSELEEALRERGVPVDELDPDDRLRDDLLIADSNTR